MKQSSKLHDEHVHLRPHGVRPLPPHQLAPMIEAYAARNIVPGIREHAPLPKAYRLGPDGDYLFCMRDDEVDAFLSQFAGTGIAVGLEVDHIDDFEPETQAIVNDICARARARGIPIGGLTGSVHLIPGRTADLDLSVNKGGVKHILCDYVESVMREHLADWGARRTIEDYFGAIRRLIASSFYDVVGHLEVIRKWDRLDATGKSTLFGDFEDVYDGELAATIRLAGEADILLEYNTAGRDIVLGRPYLSDDALRLRLHHGVRIALSSDSHLPKHAGRHFDRALATLREVGYREVFAVRDRQRIAVSIT